MRKSRTNPSADRLPRPNPSGQNQTLGTRLNDGSAPIPDLRALSPEWGGSTLSGSSRRLVRPQATQSSCCATTSLSGPYRTVARHAGLPASFLEPAYPSGTLAVRRPSMKRSRLATLTGVSMKESKKRSDRAIVICGLRTLASRVAARASSSRPRLAIVAARKTWVN